MNKQEKYVGSIKFFKNMILLLVVVAIAVPTFFVFRLSKELKRQEPLVQENEMLREQMESFALLSADGASYQKLYPDFYAEYPLPSSFETAEKTVYLTFQDGPSVTTDSILDTLEQANAKATFFVTVHRLDDAKNRLLRMQKNGHAIGMYTTSANLNKVYDSVEAFLTDMYDCYTWIKETTGVAPTVFRMPGGSVNSYNLALYREMIAEMLRRGFVPYDWNVSGMDAAGIGVSAESIIAAVKEGVEKEGRAVVVLHDAVENQTTNEALSVLLAELSEAGYQFEPLERKVKPILFTYR